MASEVSSAAAGKSDLVQALVFCRVWFDRWLKAGLVRPEEHRAVDDYYVGWEARVQAGGEGPPGSRLLPPDVCWSCKRSAPGQAACPDCGAPLDSGDANALRYLAFLGREVASHEREGRLSPAAADCCLAEVNARITSLRKK